MKPLNSEQTNFIYQLALEFADSMRLENWEWLEAGLSSLGLKDCIAKIKTELDIKESQLDELKIKRMLVTLRKELDNGFVPERDTQFIEEIHG